MAESGLQHPIAQRLRLSFDLFELGTEMMRQKLRRENPAASAAEIRERYVSWLHQRPGAEHGDGQGKAVAWPRPRR